MDYRAVLIFLCVLIAQAGCGSIDRTKTRALNATVQRMRDEIRTALDHLNTPGLIPNISCIPLNITELEEPEQHALTAQHLSSFRCYMLKMSELTPELSPQLLITSQYTQDVERLTSGRTTQTDCRLPTFEQDIDRYVYVRCLLRLLDQRLSNPKF